MLAKDLVLKELEDMEGGELLKTLEYIHLLKKARPNLRPKRIITEDHLKVQEALKNVKGSMSQFIIDERADRI